MARKYRSIRDVHRRSDRLFATALDYTKFKASEHKGGIGWNRNLDRYSSMLRKATRNITENVRYEKIKAGDKRYGRRHRTVSKGAVAG